MRADNRTTIWLAVSIAAFVVVFILALMVGRYPITFNDIGNLLSGNLAHSSNEYKVLTNLRLPRTIVAALVGIALSLSGLVYQETFQNKLVSPDFLGVSSGASVGAATAILMGMSPFIITVFAFFTGIITVSMTLLLAKIFQNRSPMILLLSGIIIGGLMSAILSLIKYLADPESTLATITFWLMGSCESSTMTDVGMLLPIVVICSAFLFVVRWRINLIALGREEALTKGVNYDLYRRTIIIIATLMTASSVSVVGCVGWIGLVIPHITRLIVGNNTAHTIPLAIVFGGVFMILVDLMSRAFTASEIPLSAITGLFGTVIIISILYFRRRSVFDDRSN